MAVGLSVEVVTRALTASGKVPAQVRLNLSVRTFWSIRWECPSLINEVIVPCVLSDLVHLAHSVLTGGDVRGSQDKSLQSWLLGSSLKGTYCQRYRALDNDLGIWHKAVIDSKVHKASAPYTFLA